MTAEGAALISGDRRPVVAAVSINILASVVTALAGLGATAFIARAVPVAEFGRIILLLTMITAFAIFEGQRPVVIHRVATRIGDPAALFKTAAHINAGMVALTLACLGVALLAGAANGLPVIAQAAMAASVAAFFVVMQFWTFLDAEQDTVFTGVSRSLAWIGLYAGFAGAAWLGLGIASYTMAILLMHVFLAAVLIWRFRSRGFARKYAASAITGQEPGLLAPALNNVAFNGCAVTLNVADRAIVGSVLGIAAAGFYSGPSELTLRAVGLVRAGVQVILPWAARLSPAEQQRYWLATVTAILLLVSSAAAVLLLWRFELAALLLGEKFRPTGDLFGIFGLAMVTSILGYTCIVQLNARGDFSTQRKLYMVGAAILLAGALWGARTGSLLNVGLAFLTARSVDLVLLALLLRACPAAQQRWFGAVAATTALALWVAWRDAPIPMLALLVMAYALGYGFWRATQPAKP